MAAAVIAPDLHPLEVVASCVRTIGEALAVVPQGPLPASDAHAIEVVVEDTTRIERQLGELKLRLARLAETSRAAEVNGSTGADAWLARLTGTSAAVMRGGLWLARMLEDRYPAVREAFAAGGIGEDHARIIVRASERMPRDVSDDDRVKAVESLVAEAVERRLNCKALRRRARRMLDAVNRAYADRHEATLLAEEEHEATCETWLALDDNGDGTWSGRFIVPELHAHLLLTVLQHLSSPRRVGRTRAGERVTDVTVSDATGNYLGLSWNESMGQAFLELCEHLPTDGLAQHGRVGATLAVHLDHERLLDGLGAARLDSGAGISIAEARRLSCNAGILPMVYGGASVPLDAGREARLHTKTQRIALSGHYDKCAAEGCERPFAWCEIHHPHAWALGGRTDLSGVPLCGWHHRRAHDSRYDLRHLTSGEVRFRRRP